MGTRIHPGVIGIGKDSILKKVWPMGPIEWGSEGDFSIALFVIGGFGEKNTVPFRLQ